MSHVLHLLKKDARGLRLPLALVYALLLAQTLLALRDPIVVDKVMPPIEGSFQLLSLLAMVVAVGRLVHQEPLVGTTAFWLTRPIRRGSLLKSKGLFLGVFLAAPVLIASVAVAFAFGLGLADLPTALGSFLLPLSAFLIVAMLLATVTPNTVTYLMTWIGLLFAGTLVSALIAYSMPERSYVVSSASQDLVWMVALVVLGGLLVIHQYLTRRTRRTVIGVGVAFLASVAISEAWRWEVVEGSNPLFEKSPVGVTLKPDEQSGAFNAWRHSDNQMMVAAAPTFSGHPALNFEIQAVNGQLQFDDRSPVNLRAPPLPTPISQIIAGLEEFRWVEGRQPGGAAVHLITQGDATFDELIARSGELRAEVYGQAYGYKLAGTMPLAVGERVERGALVAAISGISRNSAELRIVIRHRNIQTGFQDVTFPRVLMVNSTRKEMFPASTARTRYFQPSGVFHWGPLVVSREETYAVLLRPRDGVPPAVGPDWLADAELAIVELTTKGSYKTSLRMADFHTRDAARDSQALSSSEVE